MAVTNSEEVYDLTLDTTLKIQAWRKELSAMPKPKRWQLGKIWRKAGLESRIESEIWYAKTVQKISDKIERI
jgi:hypothetical protein